MRSPWCMEMFLGSYSQATMSTAMSMIISSYDPLIRWNVEDIDLVYPSVVKGLPSDDKELIGSY